jgi:CspA family cold shock protein
MNGVYPARRARPYAAPRSDAGAQLSGCAFIRGATVLGVRSALTISATPNLRTRTLSMATAEGTIKRLTDKGFGFIATAEGTEYFFHQSACTGTRFDNLREGQKVSFTVGQGPKGPRAENVQVL